MVQSLRVVQERFRSSHRLRLRRVEAVGDCEFASFEIQKVKELQGESAGLREGLAEKLSIDASRGGVS